MKCLLCFNEKYISHLIKKKKQTKKPQINSFIYSPALKIKYSKIEMQVHALPNNCLIKIQTNDICMDSLMLCHRKHMYDARPLNASSTCGWHTHMIINNLDTWAKWPWSWIIPREVAVTLLCSPASLTHQSNTHQLLVVSMHNHHQRNSNLTRLFPPQMSYNDRDYITRITHGHLQLTRLLQHSGQSFVTCQ